MTGAVCFDQLIGSYLIPFSVYGADLNAPKCALSPLAKQCPCRCNGHGNAKSMKATLHQDKKATVQYITQSRSPGRTKKRKTFEAQRSLQPRNRQKTTRFFSFSERKYRNKAIRARWLPRQD
jgi:hypothetical protein